MFPNMAWTGCVEDPVLFRASVELYTTQEKNCEGIFGDGMFQASNSAGSKCAAGVNWLARVLYPNQG